VAESSFPPRTPRRRRKLAEFSSEQVELPSRQQSKPEPEPETAPSSEQSATEETTAEPDIIEPTTPSESVPPSEVNSTTPTTPSSIVTTTAPPAPQSQKKIAAKGAIVPIVPIKPRGAIKTASPVQPRNTSTIPANATKPTALLESEIEIEKSEDKSTSDNVVTDNEQPTALNEVTPSIEAETIKAPPSSWAALFANRAAAAAAAKAASNPPVSESPLDVVNVPKAGSLADAVRGYCVDGEEKIPFLEPRGLVNTGNMCYMNSVSRRVMIRGKAC